jgi:hypothetical protein
MPESAPLGEAVSGGIGSYGAPQKAAQNFWLIVCGVGVCLLNMACAWWLINASNTFVMSSLIETGKPSATSSALDAAKSADPDKLIFLDRIVQSDVNHRNIANKQTTVIVVMAASFSLVAIGFALFVMGFEAAYTISATSPAGSALPANLVLQASSPGLICFLLAALIICIAITQRTEVKFGAFQLADNPGPVAGSVSTPSPTSPALPEPPKIKPKYSETNGEQK